MHEGDGLPGFPSVDVFIYLVTPQLEKLRGAYPGMGAALCAFGIEKGHFVAA